MTKVTNQEHNVVAERMSPAAAFELVAHKTRIEVLEALRAADGGPLSFGEIRTTVGVEDPGQCHYHVDRLTDRFVRKTTEGYCLSPAGWQLVGAVVSGGFTASLASETIAAEGACSKCDGSLVACLREGGVTVECVECGFVQTNPDLPPNILTDWPREEIPQVVGRYLRRWEINAAHGFCPNCEGRVDRMVSTPADPAAPEWFEGKKVEALVVTECRRCGFWWHAAVPIAALAEPSVVAFHHEHGFDLRNCPWWTLDHLKIGTASVSENPRRVVVPMELAGEEREFIFDSDFGYLNEHRE